MSGTPSSLSHDLPRLVINVSTAVSNQVHVREPIPPVLIPISTLMHDGSELHLDWYVTTVLDHVLAELESYFEQVGDVDLSQFERLCDSFKDTNSLTIWKQLRFTPSSDSCRLEVPEFGRKLLAFCRSDESQLVVTLTFTAAAARFFRQALLSSTELIELVGASAGTPGMSLTTSAPVDPTPMIVQAVAAAVVALQAHGGLPSPASTPAASPSPVGPRCGPSPGFRRMRGVPPVYVDPMPTSTSRHIHFSPSPKQRSAPSSILRSSPERAVSPRAVHLVPPRQVHPLMEPVVQSRRDDMALQAKTTPSLASSSPSPISPSSSLQHNDVSRRASFSFGLATDQRPSNDHSCADLVAQLELLRTERDNALEKVALLESELTEARIDKDDTARRQQELESEKAELCSSMKLLAAERDQAIHKLDSLPSEKDSALLQLASLRTSMDLLESDYQELDWTHRELESQLAALYGRYGITSPTQVLATPNGDGGAAAIGPLVDSSTGWLTARLLASRSSSNNRGVSVIDRAQLLGDALLTVTTERDQATRKISSQRQEITSLLDEITRLKAAVHSADTQADISFVKRMAAERTCRALEAHLAELLPPEHSACVAAPSPFDVGLSSSSSMSDGSFDTTSVATESPDHSFGRALVPDVRAPVSTCDGAAAPRLSPLIASDVDLMSLPSDLLAFVSDMDERWDQELRRTLRATPSEDLPTSLPDLSLSDVTTLSPPTTRALIDDATSDPAQRYCAVSKLHCISVSAVAHTTRANNDVEIEDVVADNANDDMSNPHAPLRFAEHNGSVPRPEPEPPPAFWRFQPIPSPSTLVTGLPSSCRSCMSLLALLTHILRFPITPIGGGCAPNGGGCESHASTCAGVGTGEGGVYACESHASTCAGVGTGEGGVYASALLFTTPIEPLLLSSSRTPPSQAATFVPMPLHILTLKDVCVSCFLGPSISVPSMLGRLLVTSSGILVRCSGFSKSSDCAETPAMNAATVYPTMAVGKPDYHLKPTLLTAWIHYCKFLLKDCLLPVWLFDNFGIADSTGTSHLRPQGDLRRSALQQWESSAPQATIVWLHYWSTYVLSSLPLALFVGVQSQLLVLVLGLGEGVSAQISAGSWMLRSQCDRRTMSILARSLPLLHC